jgi:hypothetical protein
MVLGRMIHCFVPSQKIFSLRSSVFGVTFVLLDVIAFVVQFVGGTTAGPAAPPEEKLRSIRTYMAGIGLQQFFIVVFLVFAVKFQLVMSKLDRANGGAASSSWKSSWRPLLYTLYASLTCITVCDLAFSLEIFFSKANCSTHRSASFIGSLSFLPGRRASRTRS